MIYIICLQGISDQSNNIKTTYNRANAKTNTSRYQILAKMWSNRKCLSFLGEMQMHMVNLESFEVSYKTKLVLARQSSNLVFISKR